MLDILSILACIFGPIWLAFCIFISWAYWIRRRSQCISYRSPLITLLAELVVCLEGILYIVRWPNQYHVPCFIGLWITQFGYPIIYCVMICRSTRLLFLYRTNKAKLAAAINIEETRTIRMFDNSKAQKMKDAHPAENSYAEDIIFPSDRVFVDLKRRNVPTGGNWFLRNQRLVSVPFLRRSVGIMLTLHFVVLVIIQCFTTRAAFYPRIGLTECFGGWEWIPHQVFTVSYNIGMLILIAALRNVANGNSVRSELAAMCTADTIINIFFFFYYNKSSWVNRVDPDGHLINIAFLFLFTFQYQMIIKPTIEAQRSQRISTVASSSFKKSPLTLCVESFELLLNNPAMMEQFKIFATMDFSVENILFYEECLKFQKITERGTGSSILAEALNIYDKFIAYESRFMVNLNGKTRQTIDDMLYQNVYTVNMFDEAVAEIKDLLFRNTFPRFLQGRRYTHHGWNSPTQV